MTDRQELLRNAVTFLNDPKTQGSPLSQRVQFLQAKGLTSQEIDHALGQASPAMSSQQRQYSPHYSQTYGPHNQYASPLPWDWRDYFITAVVSSSMAYGALALARRYLIPHLVPPPSTAYEADKDALAAQFDAADALLREIQAETTAIKCAVEDQRKRVDKATSEVENAVQEMRDGEQKTRDEMREVREEINNIREMLPKMIEKNKDSQVQSLTELQQELKSLKALLLSRGPTVSGMNTPPLPQIPPRATIPAWQLASTTSTPNLPVVPNTTPPISTASQVSSVPPANVNLMSKEASSFNDNVHP